MKILHTSDWHLGMPVGTESYQECHLYFLEQLKSIIQQEHVDAVLCAGDVYDSSVSNAGAIALYNKATTMICSELRIPLIIVAGNHDGAERLASCRDLLKNSGLYISGRISKDIEPVLLDNGKVAVYPLPFFNRDEVSSFFPEDNIRTQESAMNKVCQHIRETMDPNRCNILVTHALIVNAELSDSDRSARIGYASAISKDVFDGFDYVALGHIHKPQIISDTVRYSGSPIKFSFGSEETQQKGVVLFDTDTKEQRFLNINMLYDRKTVKGSLAEILSDESLRDMYLRLYVEDCYAGLELQAELREHFPRVLEIYGKSIENDGTMVNLSDEDLQSLDEKSIMIKFMAENFQYEPTEKQLQDFMEALQKTQGEGDVQ